MNHLRGPALLAATLVLLPQAVAGAQPVNRAAAGRLGASAPTAAAAGPSVWKRYNVRLTRGKWVSVGTRVLSAGSEWTVKLQLTLDLDSATGSQIRGQNTSIHWVRRGWGEQSRNGGDDPTSAADNAIAVHNDRTYQQSNELSLAGGGPLDYQVKVGGSGTVLATLLVFKAIKWGGTSCPLVVTLCSIIGPAAPANPVSHATQATPQAAVSAEPTEPTLPTDAAGAAGDGVVDGIASGLFNSAAAAILSQLAQASLEGYLLVFRWATTWYLTFTISPAALAGTIDPGLQGLISYLAALVMVLSLLATAMRVMWRRSGAVLADSGAGLLKAVIVIGGSWSGLGLLWTLSDRLTEALAPAAANINVAPIEAIAANAATGVLGLPILIILMSGIGFLLSLAMALVMVFRLAAVVILALLLPIAAAGAPGTVTAGWLPKLLGWILSLVFLRPMVAFIYRVGFEFIAGGDDGNPAILTQLGTVSASLPAAAGNGLVTMLVGMMTLLVAVFALPVLLKLTTWMFGGGPGGGSGAGLAMASLGTTGALHAMGRRRATGQQTSIENDLPGPAPTGGGPVPPPTGPAATPTGGAAAASGAVGGATVAAAATPAGVGVIALAAAAKAVHTTAQAGRKTAGLLAEANE